MNPGLKAGVEGRGVGSGGRPALESEGSARTVQDPLVELGDTDRVGGRGGTSHSRTRVKTVVANDSQTGSPGHRGPGFSTTCS